jgi:hypothetical protein
MGEVRDTLLQGGRASIFLEVSQGKFACPSDSSVKVNTFEWLENSLRQGSRNFDFLN